MKRKEKVYYEALIMACYKRWATIQEIKDSMSYNEPKLIGYLQTSIYHKELEKEKFDDGVTAYKLTECGIRHAESYLL